MDAEKHDGNIEYKRHLSGYNKDAEFKKITQIATQMRYRVEEDGYESIWLIGVDDDGTIRGIQSRDIQETMRILEQGAKMNDYAIKIISREKLPDEDAFVLNLHIRRNVTFPVNLRIVSLGSVDSGKSSTISCLSKCVLDDGNGAARSLIVNYPHELKSGRTSSVAQHIMGITKDGSVVNAHKGNAYKTWEEIIKQSSKLVSFFDLCGHVRYLKTTIGGLQANYPDHAFIMVAANKGFLPITYQHVQLCVCLKINFSFIITKYDMVKDKNNLKQRVVRQIKTLVKKPMINRIPMTIRSVDDIMLTIKRSSVIASIFEVDNVTGKGHDLLRQFLNFCPLINRTIQHEKKHTELHIESIFSVPGVGTVVGGQLISGIIHTGDKVWVGPNCIGMYSISHVKSIHVKKCLVETANPGSYVCLALRNFDRNLTKKGQVIIKYIDNIPPLAISAFKAHIVISRGHSTTIKVGFEPIVYINATRVTCKIVNIMNKTNAVLSPPKDDNNLRSGDTATVEFVIPMKKVYMNVNDNIIFTTGNVKAYGVVSEIL
jgi:elongation factor 1-alpha